MELISQREYARRLGISHTAVQVAIASGRISTIRGKIDPAAADREWRRNTDQSKPRNRITGQPNRRRPPGQPPLPMRLVAGVKTDGDDGVTTGYARARAARELYLAQLDQIALDQRRSTLVRADEVKVGAFNMARRTRTQLLALPGRLAASIAAARNTDQVHRILEEEIERICEALAVEEQP